jgi:hypothetical protein
MLMAGNLEQYKRLFRESYVEDRHALLNVHVLVYAIVNAVWVILNKLFIPPKYRWLTIYPIIGWGVLIFVHWWFYVRNADRLCRLRERRAIKMMRAKTE